MDKTEMMALADSSTQAEITRIKALFAPSRGGDKEDLPSYAKEVAALRLAAGAGARAVKVRHLDWGEPYLNEIKETAVSAHSWCGRYIASDHGWFLCGLTQWNEAANIAAAKAAAQADHEARILSALIPEPVKAGDEPDWRDDPTQDERWNAGCDFAMEQLCKALDVDQASVSWDAATETVDGDVQSVIWNILRARMGENWDPDAAAKAGDAVLLRERPSDCSNPMTCGWHHVSTDPEINMWLCLQSGCTHMPHALSTAQPDTAAQGGNQSDGGGGSRPAFKEERIETTNVHEDRTTSLAAVRQMAGVAPGPSDTAPAEPVSADDVARTMWCAGFKRAFDREPSDPWENQGDAVMRPHLDTARVLLDKFNMTTKAPPRSVDVEAIKRAIEDHVWTEDSSNLSGVDEAARSIAAMIEGSR